MASPALLGVSNATLGVVLAIAWLFVLGDILYRYRRGSRSRERFHAVVTTGSFWFAYSLLQITDTVTRTIETVLVGLSVGFVCVGIVAGVRWVRIRSANGSKKAAT